MDPSAASFVKPLLHERKRQAEPSPLASAREKQGEEAERLDCGAVQLGDCGPPATPVRSGSFAHRPVPPPRLAPPSPPARWLTSTRACLPAAAPPPTRVASVGNRDDTRGKPGHWPGPLCAAAHPRASVLCPRPVCLAAFSRLCVSAPAPPPTGNHAASAAQNARRTRRKPLATLYWHSHDPATCRTRRPQLWAAKRKSLHSSSRTKLVNTPREVHQPMTAPSARPCSMP